MNNSLLITCQSYKNQYLTLKINVDKLVKTSQ